MFITVDTLVKETATRSSIPSWGTSWTEEAGGLQSMRWKEPDRAEQLNYHRHGRQLCVETCLWFLPSSPHAPLQGLPLKSLDRGFPLDP